MRSEKLELIIKSKEAMLAGVQAFNNPLSTFKTESFIVMSTIAWTYLLHAYYKSKNIEYRYIDEKSNRKRFLRNDDGSIKYWDLSKCLSDTECPIDDTTKINLQFLIGLRNHIVHRKPSILDSYLSARYQACALNFNFYIKKLFGENYGLDTTLALSIQFAELNYDQAQIVKDTESKIPSAVKAYIAGFDQKLTNEQKMDERFAFRLLFTKVLAKREGQADRVIEFVKPDSEVAKTIKKEYWVAQDREKPKFLPTRVVKRIQDMGYKTFSVKTNIDLWKKYDAKNPDKGYGVFVDGTWYWYQKWIDFIIVELKKINFPKNERT